MCNDLICYLCSSVEQIYARMIPVLVYVLARCCRLECPRDVGLGQNEIVRASVYLGIYKTNCSISNVCNK